MSDTADVTKPPASASRWHERAVPLLATLALHGGALLLVSMAWSQTPPSPPSRTLSTEMLKLPSPASPEPTEASPEAETAPPEPQHVSNPSPPSVPDESEPPPPEPARALLEEAELAEERIEQERLEQKRLEQERLEQERLEQERLEQERLEQERLEQERLEQERLEQERRQQAREAQAREAALQEQIQREAVLEQQREAAQREQGRAEAAQRAAASAAADTSQYRPINKQAPDYPQNALNRRIEGECTVAYRVNTQGRVENPHVVGDCHPMFVRPSLEAARQFRYEPRVVSGQRVVVPEVKNTFHYRIE
ncbi:energy transducer TonB [Salinicola halophilus]|uniref:energy transducer TonB n=1 Tax=Salinicola halophilus TaxID=184065 RepID=UPI0013A609D1|nr:energy transducer TonB [Salinicola halophilus]